mgnify:CR=1 FL=1
MKKNPCVSPRRPGVRLNPAGVVNLRERLAWEDSLRPGNTVYVVWGYGSGFRVGGWGVIDRVFPKSFRVRLVQGVKDPYDPNRIAWPSGYVLHQIPRVTAIERWHPENAVYPSPESQFRNPPHHAPSTEAEGKLIRSASSKGARTGRNPEIRAFHAVALSHLFMRGGKQYATQVISGSFADIRRWAKQRRLRWKDDKRNVYGGYYVDSQGDAYMPHFPHPGASLIGTQLWNPLVEDTRPFTTVGRYVLRRDDGRPVTEGTLRELNAYAKFLGMDFIKDKSKLGGHYRKGKHSYFAKEVRRP